MNAKFTANKNPADSKPNVLLVDDNEVSDKRNCCQKILNRKSDISHVIDHKKHNKAIKILVLGPGNSGKSTILKQMRIIHGNNYNESDRKKYKILVINNVLEAIVRLVNAMKNVLNLNFEDDINEDNFSYILSTQRILNENIDNLENWNQNSKAVAESVVSLWDDFTIKLTFANKNKFAISDSTEYFIENIERITEEDYIPNIDDVLRARQPTTSILEYTFNIKGIYFQFVDVGGQRSERRKWINCFENVTSLLFVASLSDYDQIMSSDELKASKTTGRDISLLRESIDLFNTIINWKKTSYVHKTQSSRDPLDEKTHSKEVSMFEDVSVIIFLNKIDIFEKKYDAIKLQHYFDDFDDMLLYEQGKEFIAHKFIDCDKKRKNMYYHYTFALETKHVEAVFSAVRDSILQGIAQNSNLF